jgi:hypothetical protein
MHASTFRTRVGPTISVLGGTLMVTSFSLPLFFTAPPINTDFSNPYPPVLNGWQVISFVPDLFTKPYLALTPVAPEVVLLLLLAVIILSTSLLALFQEGSLLVAKLRSLAIFASIAVLCCFYLLSLFLNWGGSPDGAAASPDITLGPGVWLLLLGTGLSAIGIGIESIGALLGACSGMVIGYFMSYMPSIPGVATFLSWLGPLAGIFLFIGFIGLTLLGSILGGWVFSRGQARSHRSLAAKRESRSSSKNP